MKKIKDVERLQELVKRLLFGKYLKHPAICPGKEGDIGPCTCGLAEIQTELTELLAEADAPKPAETPKPAKPPKPTPPPDEWEERLGWEDAPKPPKTPKL